MNALAQELKAGGIGEDAFTEETPLPGYAILDVLGENEFLPVQVDASSVKQGVVIQAMMNVRSDLIVLIEVKDDACLLYTSQEYIAGGSVPDYVIDEIASFIRNH